MRLNELENFLEENCDFPIDYSNLIEKIGDKKIQAPNGKHQTIEEIFISEKDITFKSCREAYITLIGSVDEDFIGRKNYDDRGSNLEATVEGGDLEPEYRNQSF